MVDDDPEVDADTIPRSRLRAVWGPHGPTEAPRLVPGPPEPVRPANRRVSTGLEERVRSWAPPAADPEPAPQTQTIRITLPPRAPEPDPSPTPAPAVARPPDRHRGYAPAAGAVDLAPERPTPFTEPPRRRWFGRLRRRGSAG
ncbi:hypothetical protein JQN72_11695 [Phycicoccus sp. CSK15P-2]|uniref:hypothetical protein n=1 Tax=Phycicoccus sp. CSK15P-2 TaxID=2807627 RepID=UPI001950FC6F|nr:hypothetical protein [Phycicoccus sp. CSK15P-2]MBM6404905.1 hypothetical protein [Phycicoccus sp. CSK15P-2]